MQIDLVLERTDGITHLVECKWSRRPAGRGVVAELKRKCALYPNPLQHTLVPVAVAAAGLRGGAKHAGVEVVTLDDLFQAYSPVPTP